MSIEKNLLVGAVLLAFSTGCSQAPRAQRNQRQLVIDVSACELEVPAPYRTGYADFTLMVSFRATKQGRAAEIRTLRNLAGIEQEAIETCLSSWKLPTLPTAEDVVATFRWEHNDGWVAVSFALDGLSYEVPLGGRGGTGSEPGT